MSAFSDSATNIAARGTVEAGAVSVLGTELSASDSRETHRQKIARITLDSMVQFVGLLNAEGTVLEINKVALDAVGVELSDVEGKPFWTTFWWQVSAEVNAALREAIHRAAGGEFVRWDTEIYGRAGGKETIVIDASFTPVRDEHGQVVFIVAEGRDITEKKAYEREIERQRRELAQLDVLKTQFFANVSHEFRTPLTLMLGPIEDALADAGLPAGERERLNVAHRNSLRLLKLVNSLLDFSRIEAGRARATYEPTDLAALTTELASNFRSACERAGLRLIVDCPPLAEPVHVDRDAWEKIVLNLLSNAFKFTFEGEIEVRVRAVEGRAELTVSDTGVGIPEPELPRLFERFHRIEGQRSRTHEGSGIGLALVQELVKLHGGTIHAESGVNRGTEFVVGLPFGTAHLSRERIGTERTLASTSVRADAYVQEALRWLPDQAPSPAAAHGDFGHTVGRARLPEGTCVLVADDNADMRAYVRRLLAGSCEVRAVADGEAALAALHERRPDLVLADVMMPRLDGFGLLRAVRADPALCDIPVLLLSARAGEESRVEGLSAGADDYLVKPFTARELIARVESNLRLARLRRESMSALTESERRFRTLVEASSDVVYRMSPDWSELRQLVGHHFIADTDEPTKSWLEKYICPDDQPRVMSAIAEAVRTKSVFALEHRVRRKDGSLGWAASRAIPLRDANGDTCEWVGTAVDVTERRRRKARRGAQREILEMVAMGAPLNETLDRLMLLLEAQEPGMKCGVLIVTDDGAHFRRGSGPHLPEAYHAALDGVPIAPPYLGSCGETTHKCTAVEIPDVAAETRYAGEWRELLLSCGIEAARSTPVLGSNGRVLASLAMYFDRPRDPNPSDPGLVEIATHLAAIAIERDRSTRALVESDLLLATDLAVARQLQNFSTLLIREDNIEALYEHLLDAAVAVMRSDAASVQVLDRESGRLKLLASRGFHPESKAFWHWVHMGSGSSCGEAFGCGERVIVPDVEACEFVKGTPHSVEFERSRIRAVQSTPLISRSGDLIGMISTHWREPHEPSDGDLRSFDVLARQAADLIERAEAEGNLQRSEEQLRLATDAADVGLWDVDPVNDRLYWPVRVKAMFGISADVPVSMADFHAGLHPGDRERVTAAFAAAIDPGKRSLYDVEYRTVGKEDGVVRWIAAKGRAVFDENGTCVRVIGTAIEITARKRHEERQKLLLHELDHRVKNTLATVQSFAMQTFRNAPTMTDGRETLEARLIALSKAHDVLVREHWESADLREVVAAAMAPYDSTERRRLRVDGADLRLQPRAALALSMALHELATNAVKYGAFSNETGAVEISWQLMRNGGRQQFRLRWKESGGPPVSAPRKRGFGSRLIEQGLARDIGGDVRLTYAREGLVCTIEVPLDDNGGGGMNGMHEASAERGGKLA